MISKWLKVTVVGLCATLFAIGLSGTKSVYAEEDSGYNITVEGKKIVANGKPTEETVVGVNYDFTNNELVLNNCKLSSGIVFEAESWNPNKQFTIRLVGDNKIETNQTFNVIRNIHKIVGDGSLTMTNGFIDTNNLVIDGPVININNTNVIDTIFTSDTFTMKSGKISINSEVEFEKYIDQVYVMDSYKAVNLLGGELTINLKTKKVSNSSAIHCNNNLNIQNASLSITTNGLSTNCINLGGENVEGNFSFSVSNSECKLFAPNGATIKFDSMATVTIDDNSQCYRGTDKAEYAVDKSDIYINGSGIPCSVCNYVMITNEVINLPEAYVVTLINPLSDNIEFGLSADDGTSFHGLVESVVTADNNRVPVKFLAPVGKTFSIVNILAENYEFDKAFVNGEAIDGTTFTMPNHDITVSVEAKKIEKNEETFTVGPIEDPSNPEETTSIKQETTTGKTETTTTNAKNEKVKTGENNLVVCMAVVLVLSGSCAGV